MTFGVVPPPDLKRGSNLAVGVGSSKTEAARNVVKRKSSAFQLTLMKMRVLLTTVLRKWMSKLFA